MQLQAGHILKKLILSIGILIVLVSSYTVNAQLLTATKSAAETTEEIPQDSLGRRNPRGTVNGFIQAMADQNYVRASQYLVLSKRSFRKEEERERIVKSFQSLLDQSGDIVPYSLISNKSTGRTDDDLGQGIDLVGTITVDDKPISLYVENQAGEKDPPLWQFSAETVDAIAAINTEDQTLLDRILPDALKERKLAGVPVGHWVAVVVLVLISYLMAWGIIALISFLLIKLWPKARTQKMEAIIEAFSLPLKLYLAVWLFVSLSQHVGISIIVRQRFSYITVTIGIVAFLILLWKLTDFISVYSKEKMTLRGRISAISVILFLRRTAKMAIVIIGVIAILGAIGFDVTTWLAALGIGGIALALGAQKTVENFVGSVALITDQPIRVGDFCRVGDIKGTVESIGMRSTTLRTVARTIVTIPNGEFSSNSIENYSQRDRFVFNHVFGLRTETSPDQIRYLLVELRAILYSHPLINPEPAKVRFTGVGESSWNIEILAYIEVGNFDASQEVQEDLLLRMMDVINKSGSGFAFPSQTLYFAKDGGLSKEKSDEAVTKVKNWKENKELHLPKFDPKHIDELKGSIQYPEEGSVVKRDEDKS